MPQSIRHLIALPELRSRLLSGAGGLDRPVRWAHVCELDDPTEWLGEGDLLMTTGWAYRATPSGNGVTSEDWPRPAWQA